MDGNEPPTRIDKAFEKRQNKDQEKHKKRKTFK